MCSLFKQMVIMGNDHGDLADIVLGGGVSTSSGVQWKLASGSTNHQTTSNSFDDLLEGFGNPFTNTRDPLLHEMDVMVGGMALNRPANSGGEHSFLPHRVFGEDHTTKRSPSSNMFSRMLQISTNTSPSPIAAASPAAIAASLPAVNTCQSDVIKTENNSVGCISMEDGAGVQIPTPRNHGIKRRKSQAKKVVCIPAPAAASSRPSGEVVPSDLWAWRKYGQKPIKGSPYPRGYYRCSSSKGCSARKQVERSRTDPNMLVITYTSEHNHPWPTQRNALAGSTRSQPLKGNSSSLKNITPHAGTSAKPSSGVDVEEEQKEIPNLQEDKSKAVLPSDHHSKLSVKDEVVVLAEDEIKPCLEMRDQDFDQMFHNTYTPLPLPDPGQPHDDFFADLDELDPDPFSLMSSQGFPRDQTSHEKEGKGKVSKASNNPFMDIYDWPSTGGS